MRGCAAAIARAVVAFLDAVLRCLLSWFRSGSSPVSARRHRDPLVGKARLGEVLSDEEKGNPSLPLVHRDWLGEVLSEEEKGFVGSRELHRHRKHGRDIDQEVRQEADYLKLCGTISETPAELRNVSSEETTNEVGNVSGMGGTSVSGTNSSECFKCQEDHTLMTEIEVAQVESVPRDWSIKHRFSDGSPFPTPLVVTDDMKTPVTIYTSHKGSSLSRKRVRTCKEFVYPVLRPVENKIQKKEVIQDSPPMLPLNTPKHVNLGARYIKKLQNSKKSVAKVGFLKSPPICFPNENALYQEKETLPLEELKCQTGKPSHPDAASGMGEDIKNLTPTLPKAWDGNGIPNTVTKYKEDQKVSWHTTPFEERLSRVLSGESHPPRKLNRGNSFHVQDDNGISNTTTNKLNSGNPFDVEDENNIPNTTSKYKEDQMVSWHATPFEERLLRILSDGPNPPRKLIRGAGIPNIGTKYNEVSMHTVPFEERLSRCLSDEPNPQGNLLEETCSM